MGVFFAKMFNLGQEDAARDGLGGQAIQAARAGADYAAYQSLRLNSCAGANLALAGLPAFKVALSCSRVATSEAGVPVAVDTWVIVACNASACPAAPGPGYVERQMRIVLAK